MALAAQSGGDVPALVAAAQAALSRNDVQAASELAVRALQADELCGDAWLLLAQAREKAGDLASAAGAYEAAWARAPARPELANEAGRLALAVGQMTKAALLFAQYHQARPDCLIGANNLASVLRDLRHFDAAIEVLQTALGAHPADAMLWNTLGSVLIDSDEPETALPAFEEALRLDPDACKAWLNLCMAKLTLADVDGAMAACERALALATAPADRAAAGFAHANILLCRGELREGWRAYEARLDPDYVGGTQFVIDAPRWDLETPIAGKSLLLFGEQGLGDQVAFMNIAHDLLRDLGPDGRLTIAVDPRLTALVARAFPDVEVVALTGGRAGRGFFRVIPGVDASGFDLWTPMASPIARYRRSIEDYPQRAITLAAEPARVAHWRRMLDALPGLKVGMVWKSINMDGVRRKAFPTFAQWRPILTAPNVTFVNLQYGDSAQELEQARQALGVDIWTPPGLDLKDDLEGVAALTSALDLVIGPANASSCIAAGCGAPVWILSPPAPWTCQGSPGVPWFPTARVFVAAGYGQWDALIAEVGHALSCAAVSG